jgi:anti-sigma factor RsiW
MSEHTDWLRQIDAELDGALTLSEQAALGRHLAACPHCAGARASNLEMRVQLALAAGEPQARAVPRPIIRGRIVARWVAVALLAGIAAGWVLYGEFGGPGGGTVEDVRAAILVR